MVFEGPNCALMEAGRDKLEVDILFHHLLLKDLRGFVVELLEFWL